MRRTIKALPPPDVCRWVEGTFNIPGLDEKPGPWTGRVFLAVCAGGMQDPESCYCAEYTPSVRTEISNLRAELAELRELPAVLEKTQRELDHARGKLQNQSIRIKNLERTLQDAGLKVPNRWGL